MTDMEEDICHNICVTVSKIINLSIFDKLENYTRLLLDNTYNTNTIRFIEIMTI